MLTLLSTKLYLPTYVNHAVLTAEHTPLSPKHPLSLTQVSSGMVVDSMHGNSTQMFHVGGIIHIKTT